jgi:hypothetical protein
MFLKAIISIIFSPIILIGQIFTASKPEVYIAPKEPVATTTRTAVSNIIASSTNTTKQVEKVATTTEPKKVVKVESKPVVKTEPIKVVSASPADFDLINTNSRKTIVNIFCTTKYNDLSPISGTGVVIDEKGLILTNAHIAQYFLLKDFREKDYLKCIGRTGSPAYPKYNLELVYISPNWVKQNKTLLKDQNPKGTGESDFAFLRITGLIDGSTQNTGYTHIQPNNRAYVEIGEPVLLASYPAGFLGGLSIIQNLNVASSVTTIQDVFTFREGTIDLLSVGGTIVSQKGSSGGLVVDETTSLIGIITTSSDGDTTSSRGLNAITISHIDREIQSELKTTLTGFLSLDHKNFAENFTTSTAPELTKLITDELLKQ